MKKLKLRPEALTVESFAADAAGPFAGTVRGEEAPTIYPFCATGGICPSNRTDLCPCTPRADEF